MTKPGSPSLDTNPLTARASLKSRLLERVATTDQGRHASTAQKNDILDLINQLEDLNPTPAPTQAAELLSANWRTLYTTSQDLLRLSQLLPGYTGGNIYQAIRADQQQVINVAEIISSGWLKPLLPAGLVAVVATFTVESEVRVQVSFSRFVIGAQGPMNYEISSFLALLNHKPESIPALKIDIPPGRQQGWLDITYLDPDLRLGRGSEGSLFVLEKVT
ncbi:MAG: fimbrial protein [Synechococcaceae cyanobacterium SM2_3_2]|nr:fimbrial protein [Synechococcaceae cyanobacterium SM2_3_2]